MSGRTFSRETKRRYIPMGSRAPEREIIGYGAHEQKHLVGHLVVRGRTNRVTWIVT